MTIVGGFDLHRAQMTFDWVDTDTGEAARGRIEPAVRPVLAEWLADLPGDDGAFAVEATTGWRFVVEELVAAGFQAHLAEPADTSAMRGSKRRAKTDRRDAEHLRDLLAIDRLPSSHVPPSHLLDLRRTVRLRKTLADQRGEWQQRIHAILFHHGLPRPSGGLLSAAVRARLGEVDLPAAARHAIGVAYTQIDQLNQTLEPIDVWLAAYATRQPGCRAIIDGHYGIGKITGPTIIAELGDARRFHNREAVVRYTGLDVSVYSSDGNRSPGKLVKQGPGLLRWALVEAAHLHARPGADHHDYYRTVKARIDGNRAALSVARKLILIREIRHTLSALADAAIAPPHDMPVGLPVACPTPTAA